MIVGEGADRAPRGLHHVRDAQHAPVSSTSIHCSWLQSQHGRGLWHPQADGGGTQGSDGEQEGARH